jgi:hypothetical protein
MTRGGEIKRKRRMTQTQWSCSDAAANRQMWLQRQMEFREKMNQKRRIESWWLRPDARTAHTRWSCSGAAATGRMWLQAFNNRLDLERWWTGIDGSDLMN